MTSYRRSEPPTRLVGWVVFAAFTAFVAVGFALRNGGHLSVALQAGLGALVLGAVTIFGRELSTALVALAAVAAGAEIVLLATGDPANISWFALIIISGWLASTAGAWLTFGYFAAVVAILIVEATAVTHDPGWAAWLGGSCLTVIGCWFGSRQHDLVLELRDAQAGLALRAQAEERNRIARELHDVIAHSLTVSLLHVSSARLAVRDDPAEAERALAEAERLGRASLDEVRHAVGTLHHDDAPDPTRPLPGSTDVPALIEGFRAAGADVHASVEGELAALPATLGLATYRIVQESLTNAVKHAPRSRTTVLVQVGADAVQVDVDSAGQPRHDAGGLGLIGMRERAESVGGRFAAGPGGSGWRVHAELPLDPS